MGAVITRRQLWVSCPQLPTAEFPDVVHVTEADRRRHTGRYSVSEIQDALRADAEARGFGIVPLVVECRRTGEWGETRPPGVYFEDPVRRAGLTVVFYGEEPPGALLAPFRPKERGPGPLIVVLGSEHIDPPDDMPGGSTLAFGTATCAGTQFRVAISPPFIVPRAR